MFVAHLHRDDAPGLAALRAEFADRNPGYALELERGVTAIAAGERTLAWFVHGGSAEARAGGVRSELVVGDLVLLPPGETAATSAPLTGLAVRVPAPLPAGVPPFVRPDHDPAITDTPGGCAEQEDAYRRILVTWSDRVGPYRWRALNAHRVRMTDSFSHYHPERGGFDELYLVQGVAPGGRVHWSRRIDRIEAPDDVSRDEAAGLIETIVVERGDLLYAPRGTMHRAVGGVLAHVITAPGFVPGSEIGVDHHLAAINRRLGLTGAAALPLHADAADRVVVK